MKKVSDIVNDLVPVGSDSKCPRCAGPMKKVEWKIIAGAFDAGKEVEQTVYQCPNDKEFISVEISTGEPSEFAFVDDITE